MQDRQWLLLCRFSDACAMIPSRRTDGRRPKSAKARNRGMWSRVSAARYGDLAKAAALMEVLGGLRLGCAGSVGSA